MMTDASASPASIEEGTTTPGLRGHFGALDGLRGFAVLLVFLHHLVGILWRNPIAWWGWIGVDIFFVLSGFLITTGLFASLGSPGYFRLFYAKRALRILPLYFALWFALFLLTPIFHFRWTPPMLLWIPFLGNLVQTWTLRHGYLLSINELYVGAHIRFFPAIELGHLWSLCVEEQFYLVWPVVVFFFRDRRTLMRLCLVGTMVEIFLRTALTLRSPTVATADFLYSQTYTRLDGLLIGSWLALRYSERPRKRVTFRNLEQLMFPVATGLLFLSWAISHYLRHRQKTPEPLSLHTPWIDTFGLTLIAIATAGIIFSCLDPGTTWSKVLNFGPLRKLGRVSYGFYLIHMLPTVAFISLRPHLGPIAGFLFTVGYFVLVYGLASLSYRYYETPFLSLKQHLPGSSVLRAK